MGRRRRPFQKLDVPVEQPVANTAEDLEPAVSDRAELSDYDLAADELRRLILTAEDERTRERAAASLGRLSQKEQRGVSPQTGAQPGLLPEQMLIEIATMIVEWQRSGQVSFDQVMQALVAVLAELCTEDGRAAFYAGAILTAVRSGKLERETAQRAIMPLLLEVNAIQDSEPTQDTGDSAGTNPPGGTPVH